MFREGEGQDYPEEIKPTTEGMPFKEDERSELNDQEKTRLKEVIEEMIAEKEINEDSELHVETVIERAFSTTSTEEDRAKYGDFIGSEIVRQLEGRIKG